VEVRKSRVPLVDVVVSCRAATASPESRHRRAPLRSVARRHYRAFVVPDALDEFYASPASSQSKPRRKPCPGALDRGSPARTAASDAARRHLEHRLLRLKPPNRQILIQRLGSIPAGVNTSQPPSAARVLLKGPPVFLVLRLGPSTVQKPLRFSPFLC
jgi:hypothetical protein